MINIHLEVSQRAAERFRGDLAMFEQYLQQLSGELMKQEAGLTALAAIKFQAPIPSMGGRASGDGLGLAARRQGESAVAKDIGRIFRTTDDKVATGLPTLATSYENFLAWRSTPFSARSAILGKIHADPNIDRAYNRARNYLRRAIEEDGLANRRNYVSGGEMRSLHDAERMKYRGRIGAHGGPSREVKLSPYIVSERNLARYTKERQKRVGWMKAGWARVIERIGTVNVNGRVFRPAGGKVPAWVRRHGQGGGGQLSLAFGERRKAVKILNDAGNVDGIAVTWDVARKVIDFRNVSINSRPYQTDVDKAVSLWNAGRIKARGY